MQTEITDNHERKTYPQDWRAYNAAQVNEKEQFLGLLHDLCSTVDEIRKQDNGRPRLPLNETIFALCYKTYSTVSARRFMSDLRDAKDKGYISKTPHFNSLFNYLDDRALTPILRSLIIKTSLPLTAIETDFAVDSSGFTTSHYARWFDHKYGEKQKKIWVKVHLMCGVKTHIVTAAEIIYQHTSDSIMLPHLVDSTALNFEIDQVSADKAYGSHKNYDAIERHGAIPFIAFRISQSAGKGGLWTKMFHYFHLNQEEFMKHYHKRSNIETTFSMIKSKFGGFVRSKTKIAQTNECLCKIICHNICVLIGQMHEFGIDIDLSAQKLTRI